MFSYAVSILVLIGSKNVEINTKKERWKQSKGPVIKHVLGWAGGKIETFSKNLVAQPED